MLFKSLKFSSLKIAEVLCALSERFFTIFVLFHPEVSPPRQIPIELLYGNEELNLKHVSRIESQTCFSILQVWSFQVRVETLTWKYNFTHLTSSFFVKWSHTLDWNLLQASSSIDAWAWHHGFVMHNWQRKNLPALIKELISSEAYYLSGLDSLEPVLSSQSFWGWVKCQVSVWAT